MSQDLDPGTRDDILLTLGRAAGWDEDVLRHLLRDRETLERLVQIVRVGRTVSVQADVSPTFVDQTMRALQAEGLSEQALPVEPPAAQRSTSLPARPLRVPLWATGLMVGVLATVAVAFALLSTGGRAWASPIPLALISLVAGVLAGLWEVHKQAHA